MGDDYEPYQWQVGDPEDWGDSVGVPDIPYMGYLNGDDDGDEPPWNPQNNYSKAKSLEKQAWQLRENGQYEGALSLINQAIDLDGSNSNFFNVKAIILEDMGRYDGALHYYNASLDMNDSQIVKNNKARLLQMMANISRHAGGDLYDALKYINEALKISNEEEDHDDFLWTKGYILESMGRQVDAKICFLLAEGRHDMVDTVEKQKKMIENSSKPLVCIAGTNFYNSQRQLEAGMRVDLVREPENEYDSDAIAVKADGETVGYVANSPSTVLPGTQSASDIKNSIRKDQKAEIKFEFINKYLIAELI